MAAGECRKAAAICDLMIERNPKLSFDLLRMKAEALFQMDDPEAVAELCAGILMERDAPWATVFMGRTRYLAGDLNKARLLFTKAIKQNDTSLEAYDWLVRVDRESGDLATAQKTLTQVVKFHRNRSDDSKYSPIRQLKMAITRLQQRRLSWRSTWVSTRVMPVLMTKQV